jgi:DNA-binding MarR family transcriptional regulator
VVADAGRAAGVSPFVTPDPQKARVQIESYARLAAFRHSLRVFLHFSESEAEKAGVTGQHYQALLALRNAAHPMTINDLAHELIIKHNSAVGLVDRLVEQGLLVRRRSRDDARKVLPQLTEKGLRVVDRLARIHLDELARVGLHLAGLLRQFSSDRPSASTLQVDHR